MVNAKEQVGGRLPADDVAAVAHLLAELPNLSRDDYHLIGQRWRALAVPHPSNTKPDVNLHMADTMRAAKSVMDLRRIMNDIDPEDKPAVPLRSDDQLGDAIRGGLQAREAAMGVTDDHDAQEAIADVAMAVLLRPWIPEAMIDNVSAPLYAARPGFFEPQRT